MELLIESSPKLDLKEIVIFTHNTENLQKYIEYLITANKIILTEINDLKIKSLRIEEEQKKIPDLCFRMNVNDKKISDLYETINSFKGKFMDIEKKNVLFQETSKVVQKLQEKSVKVNEKFETVETNLNNLNKLTETNTRLIEFEIDTSRRLTDAINKEKDKIVNIENEYSRINNKIDDKYREFDSKLDKIAANILNNNQTINQFNEKLRTINSVINIQNENIRNICGENSNNLKINDIICTLDNLEQTQNKTNDKNDNGINSENQERNEKISEINENDNLMNPLNQKGGIQTVNSQNLHENKNTKQIIKENEFIQSKDLIILKTNIEMNLNNLKSELKYTNKDLNNKITELSYLINEKLRKSSSVENYESKETDSNADEKKNIIKSIFKIQSFKIDENNENCSPKNDHKNFINVANSNNSKKIGNIVDLDELTSFRQEINMKINELITKVEGLEDFRKNYKKPGVSLEYNTTLTSTSIISGIEELFINSTFVEFINKKIATQLKTFEKTYQFTHYLKEETNKHTEEINKIYESIVAIRNLINDKIDVDYVELKIYNQTIGEIQEKIHYNHENLQKKLVDDHKILIKLKDFIQDMTLDLCEVIGIEESGNVIRDHFNYFIKNIKYLLEKIDKNSLKLENLSAEIINKLRKDLWNETLKVFDDFKNDLKNNIIKIDNQLREKVDINNFNEFDKKLDQKISMEFNKKLDKHELKKNNNMINRKIDNLENKISKTLVDTLIDLQLEETPLIIKKGTGLDKCGSCNQILIKENSKINNTIYPISTKIETMSPENNTLSNKFQLKNIQDASNKLGFASYSRLISSCDDVSSEEINNLTKIKNSQSKNLPDIVLKGNLYTSQNNGYISYNNKLLNSESTNHSTDFSANNKKTISILGDFHKKKTFKPNELLKVIDKYHSDQILTQSDCIVTTNYK